MCLKLFRSSNSDYEREGVLEERNQVCDTLERVSEASLAYTFDMTTDELRSLFLEFFATKGHAVIPSASVIPENDPTVLFTTAGMHPLVPYLLGRPHPAGTRLADA